MFSSKIETCMQAYWRKLWAIDLPEKCKSSLWLISYKAILVGEWLQWRGKDGTCRSCNYDLESIKPCLWSARMQIYDLGRIIRILAACSMKGLFHLVMLNGGLRKRIHGCVECRTRSGIWRVSCPSKAILPVKNIHIIKMPVKWHIKFKYPFFMRKAPTNYACQMTC